MVWTAVFRTFGQDQGALDDAAAKAAAALNGACAPAKSFFGFPTWYKYLGSEKDALGKCTPQISGFNDAWLIGLAFIEILLRFAGIAAVAYIIYGGIQYITSQGEPDRTKAAKDIITNAIIGLIIVIVATAAVSFIGNSLK
ncbi:MAG: hypothetical protein ABIQ89_01575 [Candidatus Saccharimonadales bacterium]